MSATGPSVLILAPDAAEYAAAIEHESGAFAPLTACRTPSEARKRYDAQPVLLGAPDLIAEIIDELEAVRWVQSTWAGVRPLLEAGRRDYVLTGVKGVFGPAMAEYVVGHLLARELDIPGRSDRQRRREWFDAPSGTLRGKLAGILGTGSIGRHVAATLHGFGVQVRGLNRSGADAPPFDAVFSRGELASFLRGLDYLVCVLPDTAETRHLLNADTLAALPPHAVVVNVGRGSVLDSGALAEALRRGRLGGAVLDVFEEEPLPADSPLWDVPKLTITAHVAARSIPAEITPLFLRNYEHFVAGDPLEFVVDFERRY